MLTPGGYLVVSADNRARLTDLLDPRHNPADRAPAPGGQVGPGGQRPVADPRPRRAGHLPPAGGARPHPGRRRPGAGRRGDLRLRAVHPARPAGAARPGRRPGRRLAAEPGRPGHARGALGRRPAPGRRPQADLGRGGLRAMAVVALRTAAWYGDRPLELPSRTTGGSHGPAPDAAAARRPPDRPGPGAAGRPAAALRARPQLPAAGHRRRPARPTPAGRSCRWSYVTWPWPASPGAVRVLVASGTHGPPRPEALAAKVGPEARPPRRWSTTTPAAWPGSGAPRSARRCWSTGRSWPATW